MTVKVVHQKSLNNKIDPTSSRKICVVTED